MIPTLTPGGAERVFAFVSQNLNPEYFQSQVLVMGSEDESSYCVDKVPVTYLNSNRVLHAIPSIISFIRLHKPNIVMSSVGHLNLIAGGLSKIFKRTRFIIRPTNIQADTKKTWWESKSISWADTVVCQSKDMAQNFSKIYKIPTSKIKVIENPITNDAPIKVNDLIGEAKNLITVGRLNEIKGHARILTLLSKVNREFHYTIIGDGPERDNLFALIKKLGIENKITHIPFTNKVSEFLVKNDLFLQGYLFRRISKCRFRKLYYGNPCFSIRCSGWY
ncbi:glycosyltransferase [Zobellia nedashkovskayae]